MQAAKPRRQRKRRPTLTPRFGSSTLALEIGLIRMSMDVAKDLNKKGSKERS